MIRLVVCDDHDMVRTGLVRALQHDGLHEVVADVSSGSQLLALLHRGVAFDVLLLDLNLGAAGLMAGIDLISSLKTVHGLANILVVSMHDNPAIVQSALEAGALGYVTKDSSIELLQEAVNHVRHGRRFLDPNLVERMMVHRKQETGPAWDAELTHREREVMKLLCGGQRVSEVALSLGLSIKTVSTHKVRLMEKLNVSNNAALFKLGQESVDKNPR
ncbi:response regulator transcription factor [Paucibacter sp. DJ1R-11]|uniref:response regulator transcription factor n=1 Tax=Paucibacter sp. DJ1R-11 TaxID=2893556 RepID=UPI0021E4890C|nr:response regulator transcription factor [Paucibacter sp. DJ1R-11]MCV2361993.1 response regulator transcription factor [Paucibacter sp. DJ1R-11]